MIGYVMLAFVLLSFSFSFLAPSTFSRSFCAWEAFFYVVASSFFLRHKCRHYGGLCFDVFFIPTFFLINYAHAVFIYPDDKYLPAFQFATHSEVIPYALSLAQSGVACYMLGSVLFEKDFPEMKKLRIAIPEMAINRIAYISLLSVIGLSLYIFVFSRITGFTHLYPRLMVLILCLIALSWYYQAQLSSASEYKFSHFALSNKINIVSTLLFVVGQLYIGSRGEVIFLTFMILLVFDNYYHRIRLKRLIPVMLTGIILMGFLSVSRVSKFSLQQVGLMESLKYSTEIIWNSPNILWMLLTDFVVNAKTLYESIDYIKVNSYLMGVSYVQYLFALLPFGGSFFTKLLTGYDIDDVATGNILTRFVDASYGIGTNMIADLYMNFSFIGVVVMMFLFGVLVARVESPTSKYLYFIYMSLFANSIYLVRASIFGWLTFFAFLVIFDWLIRIQLINSHADTSAD